MLIILLKAFLLLFIITVIWDFSGVINDLTKFIYSKLNPLKEYKYQQLPKIFSCSYCVKFHTMWIYLIIISGLNPIYGLAIASLGTFIGTLMIKVLRKIEELINIIK